uniref:hypothetical protein n=1 Tax=Grateloupia cornea TaxID=176235 RepID=UPI00257F475E|nr:hypothetical protein QU394_mgp22 [Grateloupia cornea]WIA66124.1 hypothetical protein [Grateloupia cornea]
MIKYITTLLNILGYLYIKAFDLPKLGQLKGDKSMSKKRYWNSISWATLSMVRITNPFKQKGGKKVPNYYRDNCKLSIFFYIVGKIQKCLRTRNSVRIFNFVGDLRTDSDVLFKNSGNPDYRKVRGFGKIVVRNPAEGLRKGLSSIATQQSLLSDKELVKVKLEEINIQVENFVKTGKKVKGLSDLLKIPGFLEECYCKIKLSEKALAIEFNKSNASNTKVWFEELSKRIVKGGIILNSVRRKAISKTRNSGYPLEISFPEDKIVHEALEQLLKIVFEKIFGNTSLHNFKLGKTRHTTLNQVRIRMSSARWFIKGNIFECHNGTSHNILVSKLEEVIDDQLFIDIVYKTLGNRRNISYPEISLTQEKVINPLLFDIYLHNFDFAILEILRDFSKRKDLDYVKTIWNSNKKPKQTGYARFGNNFLIGITGSKNDCIQIKKNIFKTLQNDFKLILTLKKIKITHASTDGVYFLGYNIRTSFVNKTKNLQQKNHKIVTSLTNKLIMDAPIKKVVEKLALSGYCKTSGNPMRCGRLIHKPLHIITNEYSTLQLRLLNYYSMASNYKRFARRVYYILKHSCALTFASKLKLKTLKKVFKKFGKDLAIFSDKEKKNRIPYPKISCTKHQNFRISRPNTY